MAEPPVSVPTPLEMLDGSDPGDLTLERFRFQVTYSGILAVQMVEDLSDFDEIYCELHEDILVKHTAGDFTGIQVKTKDINLPPFTIEDPAIKSALVKFARLEKKFGSQFRHYSIVSNTGFDKSKPAICVNALINLVKTKNLVVGSRTKSSAFIKWIGKEADCALVDVVAMLKKLRLKSYCNLDDIHFKLLNQLKLCPTLTGVQESKIQEIADLLVGKHFQAASLGNKTESTATFLMGVQTEIDDIKAVISGKRFTRQAVQEWISSQKELPVVLLLKDRQQIASAPGGHTILELKMDAGGIDVDNVELLRNFKYAFEDHAVKWIYKDGPDVAEKKYNQVNAIVRNACQEIYDSKEISENNKGKDMLIEVRRDLKERRKDEPELFFDCTHELLLGAVGVQTEKCKIWWSRRFDINPKP